MSLRFIDIPRNSDPQQYQDAVDILVKQIREFPGIAAIFRFGNLTTPGISDIDLLAVFKNHAVCSEDPLRSLPSEYRHLLTHGVDAMSVDHFRQTHLYTFWFNSRCIWGDAETLRPESSLTSAEVKVLKLQTAVEYLVTNYIDLTLQITYGIVKLRALLQHLKGLAYDLEFLGVASGNVYEKVVQLRDWIAGWHTRAPDRHTLAEWINGFYPEFTAFAGDMVRRYPVYVPLRPSYLYARNVNLIRAQDLFHDRSGILLPNAPFLPGRKFYNLQHRFSRWTFGLPMRHEAEPIIEKRFAYFKTMIEYNQVHFPAFSHLTTGFSVNFS